MDFFSGKKKKKKKSGKGGKKKGKKYEDVVARTTDWYPLKGGGTNFRIHRLKVISPDKARFRMTIGYALFSLGFLLSGLFMGVFLWSTAAIAGEPWWVHLLVFGGAGIFAGAGGILFYTGSRPNVFDRNLGFYWRGWKHPGRRQDLSMIRTIATIEEIHAIQLLAEYISGSENSYYSYEMNLILKDGKRLNVVDHGNQKAIRKEAGILGKMLNIPVWDEI